MYYRNIARFASAARVNNDVFAGPLYGLKTITRVTPLIERMVHDGHDRLF